MATANKRVPLSCEPCRERKIRCYRTSQAVSRVCDTCVKRGVPLEECVFLRDLPRSQRPNGRQLKRMTNNSGTGNATGTETEMATNRELFARVKKLESLLSSSAPAQGQDASPPPAPSLAHSSASSMSRLTPNSDLQGQQRHASSTTDSDHRKLSRTASGHENYEPHPGLYPSQPQGEDPAEDLRPGPRRQFPFATTTISRIELLSTLPSLPHCDALKDLYSRVFGSLFHILHGPTFETEYAAFRANPQSASLTWLALLYSVLGVAVTAMDETDDVLRDLGKHANPLDNLVHLTTTYRTAAMKCLEADQYLWQHNIQTLQALILLIYGISHTHGPSWALLGTAKNIALSLGCHVDPDEFGLDIVEAEQRRRCWSALSMLLNVQNVTLGSIDSSVLAHNVKAPLDLNDDELKTGTPSQGPTQMTYLLFKFRLYELFSRIPNLMGGRSALPSYDDVTSLDAEITMQQDRWSARYLADTMTGPLPSYHAAHLQILSGYSHQLRLLLHKPVITQNQDAGVGDGWDTYSPAQISKSRHRCLESSRALLGIHAFFHQSLEISPYAWYNRGLGSFHAFHAVATIAFIRETWAHVAAQELKLLEQDVKNASEVFRSISDTGMSIICHKALPVVYQFHKRIKFLNCAQGISTHPNPPTSSELGLCNAPQTLQQSEQPEQYSSPDDYGLYMDAMAVNLQAPQWLSPSTITWDIWDNLVSGV